MLLPDRGQSICRSLARSVRTAAGTGAMYALSSRRDSDAGDAATEALVVEAGGRDPSFRRRLRLPPRPPAPPTIPPLFPALGRGRAAATPVAASWCSPPTGRATLGPYDGGAPGMAAFGDGGGIATTMASPTARMPFRPEEGRRWDYKGRAKTRQSACPHRRRPTAPAPIRCLPGQAASLPSGAAAARQPRPAALNR